MSKTTNKFSPEVRERAVRMVVEQRAEYGSEWEVMKSIAAKIGCSLETLRRWCREEASRRAGPAALAADDRERLRLLEIGRASCRERVGTYVEISVVAVSLKKKKRQSKR